MAGSHAQLPTANRPELDTADIWPPSDNPIDPTGEVTGQQALKSPTSITPVTALQTNPPIVLPRPARWSPPLLKAPALRFAKDPGGVGNE